VTRIGRATRLPRRILGWRSCSWAGKACAGVPRDVLGTLLHEAAHGMAATRQIKDTSRQGRYHNRRFAELAAELGITVEMGLEDNPRSR